MIHRLKLSNLAITTFVALAFIVISCQKDSEDQTELSGYRLISERYYYEGSQSGELSFQYAGSKITNWEYEDGLGMNFTYPDKTTILFEQYGDEPEYNYTGKFKLSGNKVIQIMMDNYMKTEYSYNSDGNVTSIKYYYYEGGNWSFDGEDTFTYTSGKLVQVYCSELDGYANKYVLTYNGDEIATLIYSYREVGEPWVDYSKDDYSYLNGKVSKIETYYNNNGTWELEDGYLEFYYDSNGNLTEMDEYYSNTLFQIKYTYEEGAGNFRQLFDFFEEGDAEIDWTFQFFIPKPSKKSSKINLR